MGARCRIFMGMIVVMAAIVLQVFATASGSTPAEDIERGARVFDEKCISCHTIGEGVRRAPDLKDVHKRRERAWLARWLADPQAMATSDPVAQELVARSKEFRFYPMPRLDLSDAETTQVLAYIEAASGGPVAEEPAAGLGAAPPAPAF